MTQLRNLALPLYPDVIGGTGLSSGQRRANLAAVRAIIASAKANSVGTVQLPPGVIQIELAATDTMTADNGATICAGLYLDFDVIIAGYGSGETIFDVYPKAPTFDCSFVYIDSYDDARNVQFDGLTMEGPTTFSTTEAYFAIKHQGNAGEFFEEEHFFDDVTIEGLWCSAYTSNEGDTYFNAIDSTFWCGKGGLFPLGAPTIGFFNNFNVNKRLRMDNCVVSGIDGEVQTVGIYISPSCSLICSQTFFYEYERFGIYGNGTSSVDSQFATVDQCFFDATCGYAIQAKFNGAFDAVGTQFRNTDERSFVYYRDTNITGCSFYSGYNAILNYDTSVSGYSVNIGECSFRESTAPSGSANNMIVAASGIQMTVDSCKFYPFTATNYCIDGTDDDTQLTVVNCDFYTTATPFCSGVAVGSGAASVTIDNCRTHGTCYLLHFVTESTTISVDVRNCNTLDGYDVYYSTVASGGRMTGRDNVWGPNWFNNSATISQYLYPRRALAQTPIASGAAVVLDPSFNTFFVSGTTTIDNLYFIASNFRFFCGDVYLIATGAWATSSSGNIAQAVTMAANEVLHLVYNPAANKWYVAGTSTP